MNMLTNFRIKELHDECDEGQESSEFIIAFARIIETEVAAPFIKEIAELKEQLSVYQQAEMAALKESNAKERAQEIVDLLFPSYDVREARSNPARRPVQWHEKSWWWNGASIVWHETGGFDSTGGEVKIESYVGGGETDSTIIYIRKEWLDANDSEWQSLVENYKQQKFVEKQEQIKIAAVAKANAEIATAKCILQKHGVKD